MPAALTAVGQPEPVPSISFLGVPAVRDLKSRERIALNAVSLLLMFLWVAAGVFFLAASVRDSPLLPPKLIRQAQLAHFPQGWAFFTRSPREPELTVFRQAASGWSAVNMRNASWGTFLGLKKGGAVNGIELGAVAEQIRDWDEMKIAWQPLLPSYPEIADASYATVKNDTRIRSFCGEALLVLQEPVPWAWARSGAPVKIPSKFKKVRIECE